MNKTNFFGLGVFVCLFNNDLNKILLLERNDEKQKKWGAKWGNVGGKIEFREYSKEACIRETKEEINIILDSTKLNLVLIKETPYFTPNYHAIHFVYATKIDENTEIKINSESNSYSWFDIDNLPDNMLDEKEFIINILTRYKRGYKIE
jgi:ADP-ribose pyrophosphatase YjhB (NUDIX family)